MTAHDLPPLALSVRQPWGWAIINGGKDIENRIWPDGYRALSQRGRIAVHASKKITREEYGWAREFMQKIGIECPNVIDLPRGGIIGSVEVVDVVNTSDSKWFMGPRGLVLKDPLPHAFVPALGALGYFRWVAADGPAISAAAPARWMLQHAEDARDTKIARECIEELQENPTVLIEGEELRDRLRRWES